MPTTMTATAHFGSHTSSVTPVSTIPRVVLGNTKRRDGK